MTSTEDEILLEGPIEEELEEELENNPSYFQQLKANKKKAAVAAAMLTIAIMINKKFGWGVPKILKTLVRKFVYIMGIPYRNASVANVKAFGKYILSRPGELASWFSNIPARGRSRKSKYRKSKYRKRRSTKSKYRKRRSTRKRSTRRRKSGRRRSRRRRSRSAYPSRRRSRRSCKKYSRMRYPGQKRHCVKYKYK